MKLGRISLLASLIATLGGCTSSTNPGMTTSVIPAAGSTFTTSRIPDPPDGSQPIVTHAYVTQSDTTEFGMPNSIALTTVEDSQDTLYFSYASNGDVLLYVPGSSSWMTLPFGSQKTIITSIPDGTGGTVTDTVTGTGPGSTSIHGNSYPTQKIEIRQTNIESGFTGSSVRVYEFAPSIGFFTKVTETSSDGGSTETLTDFTLN